MGCLKNLVLACLAYSWATLCLQAGTGPAPQGGDAGPLGAKTETGRSVSGFGNNAPGFRSVRSRASVSNSLGHPGEGVDAPRRQDKISSTGRSTEDVSRVLKDDDKGGWGTPQFRIAAQGNSVPNPVGGEVNVHQPDAQTAEVAGAGEPRRSVQQEDTRSEPETGGDAAEVDREEVTSPGRRERQDRDVEREYIPVFSSSAALRDSGIDFDEVGGQLDFPIFRNRVTFPEVSSFVSDTVLTQLEEATKKPGFRTPEPEEFVLALVEPFDPALLYQGNCATSTVISCL